MATRKILAIAVGAGLIALGTVTADVHPAAAVLFNLEEEGAEIGSASTPTNSLSDIFTLLTPGTPGSDLVLGEPQTDILFGRGGNDRLLGVNPGDAIPGQGQIDILLGGPRPVGGTSAAPDNDLFILGDENNPYYAGKQAAPGTRDFAVILDFQPSQDTIRLNGTQSDYRLVEFNVPGTGQTGTAIFLANPVPDLIAVVPRSDLSLDADYVEFDNTPPPAEPVLPQIQQLGTPGVDTALDVATDSASNVYATGLTTGNLGGPNAGADDAFLTKYDSNGSQQWIQQLGTPEPDFSFGTAVDSTHNVYITGSTGGDLGGPSAGADDSFLAKYDSNGNLLQINQFGTSGLDLAYSTAVDSADNVYVTGYSSGDLGGPNAGAVDVYVTKFDSNGNQQWVQQFGTPDFDESFGVAVDNNGNVFSTGWTQGDLGGPNAGLYDAWLAKLTNSGDVEWIRQFGTTDYEFAWDVATDNAGNAYSTGFTLGDLGGPNAGLYDVFLAKYDTNGNQQWIQQFGTSGSENAFGIDIDSDGNIHLTGFTTGELGGPNAGGDVVGADDSFFAKFDSNGNLLEINQFGTSDIDRSFGIDVNSAGMVYLAGTTTGSLGEPNAGSFDAWVTNSSDLSPQPVPEPSESLGMSVLLASGAVVLLRRAIKTMKPQL